MSAADVRDQVISLREDLAGIFVSHQVVLAYLFGSHAKGIGRPSSDVDIAVLIDPQVPEERWLDLHLQLADALSGALGRENLDVVLLNRATGLLGMEVVRDGILLFEDPETMPASGFWSYAVRYYADTQHFRDISREYLEEWVAARSVK